MSECATALHEYVSSNGLRTRAGNATRIRILMRVDPIIEGLLDPSDGVHCGLVSYLIFPALISRHCGPWRGQPAA